MLQGAGDGVDVEVWVGDVVVARVFLEAGLDGFHLTAATGFAVDTFGIHAALLDFFNAAADDGGNKAVLEFAAEFKFRAEQDC